MKNTKRKVGIELIFDVHLATHSCRAYTNYNRNVYKYSNSAFEREEKEQDAENDLVVDDLLEILLEAFNLMHS